VLRLLEKDREARFDSAADVRAALKKSWRRLVEMTDSKEEFESDARRSIAVLPFSNVSASEEQAHFCDGLTEDIINNLAHIDGIRVIARTSAFAYRGRQEDVRVIGQKLGVAYMLEGSVRRASDQIRVSVQLVEVADGTTAWAEQYDRDLSDVFAIQDDITRRIIESLRIRFGARQIDNLSVRKTDNIRAVDLYYKGRELCCRRTRESMYRARDLFEAALDHDSDYLPAMIGLADTHFLLYAYEYETPAEAVSRARTAALEALKVNPGSGEAYTTLGGIATYHDWDWQAADAAFKKAVRLTPGYAQAHQWYAELLMFTNDDEKADRQFMAAEALDPESAICLTMHGMFCHKIGRLEQSAKLLEQAVALGSETETTCIALSFVYRDLNRMDEAAAMIAKARNLSEDSPYAVTMWGHYYTIEGDRNRTREAYDILMSKRSEEIIAPSYWGILLHGLNRRDDSYGWFETALRVHDYELAYVTFMPYYRVLRDDAHLAKLLKILGLTDKDMK
jgi:TolB-like protein/Tfp pilus assembly protein PilF